MKREVAAVNEREYVAVLEAAIRRGCFPYIPLFLGAFVSIFHFASARFIHSFHIPSE